MAVDLRHVTNERSVNIPYAAALILSQHHHYPQISYRGERRKRSSFEAQRVAFVIDCLYLYCSVRLMVLRFLIGCIKLATSQSCVVHHCYSESKFVIDCSNEIVSMLKFLGGVLI